MKNLSQQVGLASVLVLNACSSDTRVKLEDLGNINPSIIEVNNNLERKYREVCPEMHHPSGYLLVSRRAREELVKYIDKHNPKNGEKVLDILETSGSEGLKLEYEKLPGESKKDSKNLFVKYKDLEDKIWKEVETNKGNWMNTDEVLDRITEKRDRNLAKSGLVINPGKNNGWFCDLVWGAVNEEDLAGNEDALFVNTSFETYVAPATPDAYVKYFENR